MKYIKHIAGSMHHTGVQRCVLCAGILSDYRNAVWPSEQGPPKGWAEGEVYVTEGHATTICPEAEVVECTTLPSGQNDQSTKPQH